MEEQAIREAMRRRPFVPFTLKLRTGQTIEIPTFERMGVGKGFILVTSEHDDSHDTYDISNIDSLTYHSPVTSQ